MSEGSEEPKGPVRVLLVEDDADHLAIARRHLGKLPELVSSVETARDLEQARERLGAGEPALGVALVDLSLPDSPLEETVELLGELGALGGVPVIAMSSLDTEDIRQRARDAGAAGFLSKMRLRPQEIGRALAAAVGAAPRAGSSGRSESAAPPHTGPSPDAFDPLAVASRLAHDANSWLTNATFRLAAIRTEAEASGADLTLQHVAAIDASLEALGDAIRGSRALVLDEIAPLEPAPLRLASALPSLVTDGPIGDAACEVQGEGDTVMADLSALSTLARIVLDNAARASDGRCTVRFDVEGHGVRITDDGGPWDVSRPDQLGTCGYRGRADSRRPGLGLFRARRLMERMGGSLAIEPRLDHPGAYALELTFLSPPSA